MFTTEEPVNDAEVFMPFHQRSLSFFFVRVDCFLASHFISYHYLPPSTFVSTCSVASVVRDDDADRCNDEERRHYW